MDSQATSDGNLTLTATFALGTDLDKAQVQVQNRVARATPRLPQEVQQLGITTEKASPNLTMVVHLTSPDGRYDQLWLSNYARLNLKDNLARLEGSATYSCSVPASTDARLARPGRRGGARPVCR